MSVPRLYRTTELLLSPLLDRCYDVAVEGMANLPDHPVILAANHRSFIDSPFIAHATRRPVAFLAKAEYFDRPWSKRLLTGMGQIPLRRGSPTSARMAIAAAREALGDGWSVAIYPEGTRSRDGRLHRGNTGAARLSCQAKVPIVPVGITGTEAVQPPGKVVPRPFKTVTVRCGKPIAPPAPGAAGLRAATDQLMATIAALCGQEYDDHYAPIPATEPGDGRGRSTSGLAAAGRP